MKTNNNTHNENRNGMAFIINYAAELMNNGATVTTAQKYGVILREIRKDNEYVCLCASDFAKAAAIAADLLTATDDEDMNAANAATAARKAAEAQKKTSNNSANTTTRRRSVVADYIAGTWDGIKNRTRRAANAARRFAIAAARVAWLVFNYILGSIIFIAFFASALGLFGLIVCGLSYITPHIIWLRVILLVPASAVVVGYVYFSSKIFVPAVGACFDKKTIFDE